MLKTLYTIFGIGVVSLYSVAAMLGWEITGSSGGNYRPMRDRMAIDRSTSGTTAYAEENDAD